MIMHSSRKRMSLTIVGKLWLGCGIWMRIWEGGSSIHAEGMLFEIVKLGLSSVAEEFGLWGSGFSKLAVQVRGQSEETMFATAILWARKLGPRPIKLANLGEQVQVASQTLYKVIEQHGPITLSDCWNHASQMENHGLKSKRHMKMMLRWMRERRTVRLICQHGEDGKSSDPNEREFLFTVVPPKVDREPRTTSQRDSAPPAE